MSKIQIYAAGGFGINVGTMISSSKEICFIDTSEANRTAEIDPSRVFQIPGVNGAGQDRRKIYAAVLPHIPAILERHQPADFNIVIFSASGG